jgi:hypothetical protein
MAAGGRRRHAAASTISFDSRTTQANGAIPAALIRSAKAAKHDLFVAFGVAARPP